MDCKLDLNPDKYFGSMALYERSIRCFPQLCGLIILCPCYILNNRVTKPIIDIVFQEIVLSITSVAVVSV